MRFQLTDIASDLSAAGRDVPGRIQRWWLRILLVVAGSTGLVAIACGQDLFLGYSIGFRVSDARDSIVCTISIDSFSNVRAIAFGLNLRTTFSATDTQLATFSSATWIGPSIDRLPRVVKQKNGFVRVFVIQKSNRSLISWGGGPAIRMVYLAPHTNWSILEVSPRTVSTLSMVSSVNTFIVKNPPVSDIVDVSGHPIQLQVYPNPTNGSVTLQVAVAAAASVRIDLYDLLGRQVFHSVNSFDDLGVSNRFLNLQRLSEGIYFLRAFATFADGRERVVTKKLLKIR